jgi:FkbH-like protein
MRFLEAQAVLAAAPPGDPLPLLLGLSGSPGALPYFLRAQASLRGRRAEVRTLPFNTLQQHLLTPRTGEELLLLLPWDLAPACDWRSGIPLREPEPDMLLRGADATASRLRARGAHLFYLPAPVPPLFAAPGADETLVTGLARIARESGAAFLPPTLFSLRHYLASGTPFDNEPLGEIAARLCDTLLPPAGGFKVLVTDLDQVMWRGVIGEEGVAGIQHRGEGAGFPHFLYQTLLAQLKQRGVLLAAVSRNDDDLARAPFRSGEMVLREADLTAILASYQPKSAQIEALARRLGLGLDAFVFVDDNPVELEEVGKALPAVRRLRFPAHEAELPAFLQTLSHTFHRGAITPEDRERTELYRRRLAGMAPEQAAGADLTTFLQDLEMHLTISERTRGDRARAVQLINKTNQFNLNGRRFTDEEVADLLADGGRLFVAALSDRHGSHGEILACLIGPDRVIRALVLSCRVLQRRAEYAFLAWLAASGLPPVGLAYLRTERNEPLRQFIDDPAFTPGDAGLLFDPRLFAERHHDDLALFRITAG